MREEEGMSKRCECQCLLEGWEGDGGRGLKLLLAGSQLEHDRHNLPHMRSAWLVAGASEWVFWVFGDARGPLVKACCGCCCDSVSKIKTGNNTVSSVQSAGVLPPLSIVFRDDTTCYGVHSV